ncbi:MAG: hypothetical protein Q7S87_09180 [Agitococcus sp.]|nr:hypothetical protein [Agitococcus sp.]MDO9179957.1 hypothetical protein [Agitococcus sp.]
MKLSRLAYLAFALPFTCHAFDLPFGIGTNTARWSEEVRQPDGSVLILKREAKRQSFGFPLAHRGRPISHSLSYAPLNLSWSADWSGSLISFEIIEGAPYLVLAAQRQGDCEGKKASDFSVKFLKWTGKQWHEIKQQDAPLEQMHHNLYYAYWDNVDSSKDAKGLVTLQKKKDHSDSSFEYRSLAVYLEKSSDTCEVLTRMQGGRVIPPLKK